MSPPRPFPPPLAFVARVGLARARASRARVRAVRVDAVAPAPSLDRSHRVARDARPIARAAAAMPTRTRRARASRATRRRRAVVRARAKRARSACEARARPRRRRAVPTPSREFGRRSRCSLTVKLRMARGATRRRVSRRRGGAITPRRWTSPRRTFAIASECTRGVGSTPKLGTARA